MFPKHGIVDSITPKGYNSNLLIYPVASFLIGGIIGWLICHNYIYNSALEKLNKPYP